VNKPRTYDLIHRQDVKINDYPTAKGYQVRLPTVNGRRGKTKWFGFKRYGSKAGALRAALEWRDANMTARQYRHLRLVS